MKQLLILGAGTGGTIMANKMRKKLSSDEWSITILDKSKTHYYQPGFLFIPFGYYTRKNITKPVRNFIKGKIDLINNEVEKISPDENKVLLKDGTSLSYDILIIATGTQISPQDTPGLKGELWQKKVFDFYTIEGSEALATFFKNWKGGNLVINIADNPIKCPVAPLEFSFFADEFFTKKGIREKVTINYVTPLSGAFTKPKASKLLGSLLEKKNINLKTWLISQIIIVIAFLPVFSLSSESSTASLIAMPSEPWFSGSSARIFRPDSVLLLGLA